MSSTSSRPGPQASPSHNAEVIALIQAKLAAKQKVAVRQHQVDVLTLAHFHLTNSLTAIDARPPGTRAASSCKRRPLVME